MSSSDHLGPLSHVPIGVLLMYADSYSDASLCDSAHLSCGMLRARQRAEKGAPDKGSVSCEALTTSPATMQQVGVLHVPSMAGGYVAKHAFTG